MDCEEFHQSHFMLLNITVGGGFTNVGGRRRKLQGSSSSSGCDNGSSSSAGGASSSSSSGGCSPRLPEQVTAPIPATMAVDYLRIFDNGFTKVIAPIPDADHTASPVGQIIAQTPAPPSASPVASTPTTAVPTASPIGQIIAATAPPSISPVASKPTAVPIANNNFLRTTSSPSLHKGTPAPTFSVTGRGTSSGKGGKGSSKAKSSKGGKAGKGGKASKGGKAGKGGKASKGNDVSSVTANLDFSSAAARSNMAPVLTILATTALYMVGVIQL